MSAPSAGRRCPSCGSHLPAAAVACGICGQRVPWRWTRRGVLLESAAVVAVVAAIGLGLLWVRRSGGQLMRPEERIARLDVVDHPPTDVPTFTPEPSATPPPAPPASDGSEAGGQPTPATVTHVVAAGESMFAIATQYDVAPDEIAALNGLERPEALSVGQVLTIPVSAPESGQLASDLSAEQAGEEGGGGEAAGDEVPVADESPTTEASVGAGDVSSGGEPAAAAAAGGEAAGAPPVVVSEAEVYAVKSGDTLGGIAARYGLPLDSILELNGSWLQSADQMLR